VALIVSLALTPVLRRLAIRNGVVDWPDRGRKNHARPIAYLGGAAIFLGWLAGMFTCFFITPHDPRVLARDWNTSASRSRSSSAHW
jgi:UDP-N-acetylmuramyl pentapeptide phosphotransferase/UDP-N-acetylglucosamine-1-phosphate transferase